MTVRHIALGRERHNDITVLRSKLMPLPTKITKNPQAHQLDFDYRTLPHQLYTKQHVTPHKLHRLNLISRIIYLNYYVVVQLFNNIYGEMIYFANKRA